MTLNLTDYIFLTHFFITQKYEFWRFTWRNIDFSILSYSRPKLASFWRTPSILGLQKMAQYSNIQKFLVPLPQILEFQLAFRKLKNGSTTMEILCVNYVSLRGVGTDGPIAPATYGSSVLKYALTRESIRPITNFGTEIWSIFRI